MADTQEYLELLGASLKAIGERLEIVEWNKRQEEWQSPLYNNGEEWSNDTFEMQAFCWCDGAEHPEGCPPNFKWRDLEVEWYKWVGRGMSVNIELTPEIINQMLNECLDSIREDEL